MPLIIDENIFAASTKQYNPTFFHSDLNGNGTGKGRSRLHEGVHPANPDLVYEPVPNLTAPTRTHIDEETSVRNLVTQPILETALDEAMRYGARSVDKDKKNGDFYRVAVPALLRFREVTKAKKTTTETDRYMFDLNEAVKTPVSGWRLWLNLEPQTVAIRKRGVIDAVSGRTNWTHSTHVRYRMEIYAIPEALHTQPLLDHTGATATDTAGRPLTQPDLDTVPAVGSLDAGVDPLSHPGVEAFALIEYTCDVPETLAYSLPRVLSYLRGNRTGAPTGFDDEAFEYWSSTEYRIYERLCASAETFSTTAVADAVVDYIRQSYAIGEVLTGSTPIDKPYVVQSAKILGFLDNFTDVPLEAYSQIYADIKGIDPTGVVSRFLINSNVQLKQNAELSALSAKKPLLPVPAGPDPAKYQLPARYSAQQRAAITTTDPLVMVIAAAGAGKTTVVTERIRMLTQGCGVDPANITCWSFTNAAADEIRDRNEGIVSRTIASAILDVYTTNFNDQQLSTPGTIANRIQHRYGPMAQTDPFFDTFQDLLRKIDGNETNAVMVELSNFIEANIDRVINVLNEIQQTTLELQIIISYLLIEHPNFKEPNPSPQYLIIDEVQDNSAFQFVYALRYAARHHCALYLVGDASQTLYEFRSANPKALTALEASNVFQVCKLSTNYRSKQEILDFANIHLRDIEANRFAQIQMNANDLRESTPDSFSRTVGLMKTNDRTRPAFRENMVHTMTSKTVHDYVEANLAAGEETVVLSKTRDNATKAAEALKKMFPNQEVMPLMNDQAFISVTLSKFVANYWDEVTAVDPGSASRVVFQQVLAHLPYLTANATKAAGPVQGMLNDWWLTYGAVITTAVNNHYNGFLSREEFFEMLAQTIFDFEISVNDMNGRVTRRENNKRRADMAGSKPLLMVSTIHGVKGMEFDHVIYLVPPDSDNSAKDEALKRETYVALTRAKIDELVVVASGNVKNRMITAYDKIVETLTQRENAAALRSAATPVGPDQPDDPDGPGAPVSVGASLGDSSDGLNSPIGPDDDDRS